VKALHDAGNEIAGHGNHQRHPHDRLSPEDHARKIREVNRIVKT